jgi:hypothetical protein
MHKITKDKFSSYASTFVGIFILFFICIILFAPCFKGFFIIDYFDYLDVLFNKNNLASCFTRPFITEFSFRPIEAVEFFLCYNLFGLNPKGYLALGMLFFAISLIPLYYLIFILSRSRVLSFISCFLITVHPLHLEEFGAMCPPHLCFLFFSYSLLCYFLSLSRHKKVDIFYILSLIFCLLAVFTREDTLTLPFFILIYHLLFDRPLGLVKIIKRTAGFFMITGVYLFIRFPILGLWLAKQKEYNYDFFNISHAAYNYKLFTSLAFKIITNPFNLVSSLNLYSHNLVILKELIILSTTVIILYLLALIKKEGSAWPLISKMRLKIFLLGCLWYLVGLIPYIFINDNSHGSIRYVLISMVGLAMAISILMLEIHRRVHAFNRYLANSVLLFLMVSIFCSTLLISRRVNVDKQQYIYLGYLDLGILTRKYITSIKELYPAFPVNSQIYLVNFNRFLRIPQAIQIFYNDKSLKTILLSEHELKKTSMPKDNKIFVFKASEDGKISDLTPEYLLKKE